MPVIQEYSASPNLGLQTNDRAVDARNIAARTVGRLTNESAGEISQLGQRIGGTISQVGNAVDDYNYHKEVSAGSLATSQVLLAKQNEWNQTVKNADPNDPSVQGKFLDGLEDTFAKMKDGFSTRRGQEWADSRIAQIRQHFTNTTTADMSTLAGIAAHNNFIQGTNMLTSLVDKDPHALDTAAAMLSDNVKSTADSSPTLKGIQAEKFKSEATQKGMEALVKTAVQASIRRGGDGTEISDNPKYAPYINAGERQQFVSMQRQEQRAAQADARMARMEQRQAIQDSTETNLSKVIASVQGVDGAPKISAKDVAAIPDNQMSPAGKENAIRLIERYTKDEPAAKVSNETWKDLMSRIYLPPDDPRKIRSQSEIMDHIGDLTKSDFHDLINEVNNPRGPQGQREQASIKAFVNGYKEQLDRTVLGKSIDPTGGTRVLNFEYDLRKAMDERGKAGKNPLDLLDKTNPEYFGKRINNYVGALDVRIRSQAGSMNRVPQGDPTRPPLKAFERD